MRELIKLILLEKVRDAVYAVFAKCRRSKKKRKVMYGKNDGTAMFHKSKHCRSLKLSKKDVLKIKLRMHCADRETGAEEA